MFIDPVKFLDDHGIHAPDMSPMVDVLFILIVFLVLMVGNAAVPFDVSLPRVDDISGASDTLASGNTISLEISENHYSFNGDTIKEFSSLKSRIDSILETSKDLEFMIASDRDVAVEKMIKLLFYLNSKGVKNFKIFVTQDN